MTWDYADVQRRAVPGRSRMVAPLATLVAQSYPPNCQMLDPLHRPGKLMVGREDMYCLAPLASPETLSDASSMDSLGSKRYSNGYQKLTSSIYKMAPIAQSPLRPTRSDGFCPFPEQPSPSELKYFPASSPGGLPPSCHMIPSVEREHPVTEGEQQHLTHSPTPSLPHQEEAGELGVPHIPPVAQSTPIKPSDSAQDNSSMMNFFDLNSLSSATEDPVESDLSSLHQVTCPTYTDLGVAPLPNEGQSQQDTSANLTEVEQRIQSQIAHIEASNPYQTVFENGSFARDEDGDDAYVTHSPDSGDVSAGVLLYHPIQGHYSPAGRGYPHGYYVTSSGDEGSSDNMHNPLIPDIITTDVDVDNNLVSVIVDKGEPLLACSSDCDCSSPELIAARSPAPVSPPEDLPCPKLVPPEICIDLCDADTPSSGGSQEDLLPVTIIDEFPDLTHENYHHSITFDSRVSTRCSSTSSSETDSEDYEHMSDTPIQILTNEAYL